ncbi:hypothetical protein [Propionivibrio sp.]|uniref:hypothetical protein n=1 Tax=Propionivibrio sp. TaxID=2212460 RepID=UPI003BF3DE4C
MNLNIGLDVFEEWLDAMAKQHFVTAMSFPAEPDFYQSIKIDRCFDSITRIYAVSKLVAEFKVGAA